MDRQKQNPKNTSWEKVHKWYDGSVGDEGHYYHKHVVLPGVLRLLQLSKEDNSLLDLACGNGILSNHIPASVHYTGVDLSPSLVNAAVRADSNPIHRYFVADITKPLPIAIKKTEYTHATIVLAVQNLENPKNAFQNAAQHLVNGGKLVIAMNHPCFRVPRQSSWKVDEQQKIQYRRIDKYSSSMKIPIQTHPSKGKESSTTWSFHYPLAAYTQWLYEAGFVIELIEEWHSNKKSTGSNATMENRSREEIPLFLAIVAKKVR